VILAMNMQTSFLTPPFGFSLFYLRGVTPAGDPHHGDLPGRDPVHHHPVAGGGGDGRAALARSEKREERSEK
jgi:hypothetical protein